MHIEHLKSGISYLQPFPRQRIQLRRSPHPIGKGAGPEDIWIKCLGRDIPNWRAWS
jgi:hypothetical protein